ncbi:hypothetical protein LPLAFNJD_LOCUS4443 [Methylorubrum aminovorans]
MTFPIGLRLNLIGLGAHADPPDQQAGATQPAFDPRRGAGKAPERSDHDARPGRAADPPGRNAPDPTPGNGARAGGRPDAASDDGGQGLSLGLKADRRHGLDVGLSAQLGPLADLGLRLQLGGGEGTTRPGGPDAVPRAGALFPKPPDGLEPQRQDAAGGRRYPIPAGGPNDGMVAGGPKIGPAIRLTPDGPRGPTPDPARPGLRDGRTDSQPPLGQTDGRLQRGRLAPEGAVRDGGAPLAGDRPSNLAPAGRLAEGRVEARAAARGPVTAAALPADARRQALTEGLEPGQGSPPTTPLADGTGRDVPGTRWPDAPPVRPAPPGRPEEAGLPDVPAHTEGAQAAPRRDTEAPRAGIAQARAADAPPVRTPPNAGAPPPDAAQPAAGAPAVANPAATDPDAARAADILANVMPPRAATARPDAAVRTREPTASAPASEHAAEAAPPVADPHRQRMGQGQAETAAVNEGRQARTADIQAAQRGTAAETGRAWPHEGVGLAAPASPGFASAAETGGLASLAMQPVGGGPRRGEAPVPNAAPAQAVSAAPLQAGVTAAPQAGTAAPLVSAAPVARTTENPPAPAAAGAGLDASGASGVGAGLSLGPGSGIALAGGGGVGGVPLPLFNPFLARRSQRDARRQAGLPERTSGLWAILRVLGWRRRRRGQDGVEPGPAEDEAAAALRAWRAALGRREGA